MSELPVRDLAGNWRGSANTKPKLLKTKFVDFCVCVMGMRRIKTYVFGWPMFSGLRPARCILRRSMQRAGRRPENMGQPSTWVLFCAHPHYTNAQCSVAFWLKSCGGPAISAATWAHGCRAVPVAHTSSRIGMMGGFAGVASASMAACSTRCVSKNTCTGTATSPSRTRPSCSSASVTGGSQESTFRLTSSTF